jgi:hypothetical protein
MTLHLIPEPEEKASELLRDLTANDSRCTRELPMFEGHPFAHDLPAALERAGRL